MRFKTVLILLFSAIFVYAAFWAYKQYQLLQSTTIKIIKYSISGLLTKSASLTVVLKVTNNSNMDLQAKNGSFDIYLNDVFISKVPVKVTQVLKSKQTIELPVTAYFNPAIVVKQGVQSLLSNPNNVHLTIKGSVTVLSNYISLNNLKINEKIVLSDILK